MKFNQNTTVKFQKKKKFSKYLEINIHLNISQAKEEISQNFKGSGSKVHIFKSVECNRREVALNDCCIKQQPQKIRTLHEEAKKKKVSRNNKDQKKQQK